jgi:hypothetical protein
MADRIFPSENDVHDVSGGGRKPTEENLTLLRNTAAAQISFYKETIGPESVGPGGVLTGYDFSAGTATSVTLTAGTATIQGFAIETTTTIVGVLTASLFNHVFLTLDKTLGLVTGISLTVVPVAGLNAAVIVPPDSILLWVFETDGVNIITQFDFRSVGSNVLYGKYTGNGAASRTFDLGFRPKMVHVYFNEDRNFVAQSPLAIPRQSGAFIQAGIFHGQTRHVGAIITDSPMSSLMTSSPELVPLITKDGFSIEDGPGEFPSGGTWLTGNKTFDPPSTPAGGTFVTSVTVPGVRSIGSLVRANHPSLNVFTDWELQVGSGETKVTGIDTVQVMYKNISPGIRDVAIDTLIVHVFETASVALWSLNENVKQYFFIAWF